jgi:Mlc titration factor MtfA (ptsG expression regulator)
VTPSATWAEAEEFIVSRWAHLDATDVRRIMEAAGQFELDWIWEGIDGFTVTAEMRTHISALAALLVFEVGTQMMSDVTSVLVAAAADDTVTRQRVGGGLVTEGHGCVLGRALLHGPVRLAWAKVVGDMPPDSTTSVVMHEFAHKIDMADGEAGGTPPMSDLEALRDFERVADQTLVVLRTEGSPVLRPYAGTNRTELFAVGTEAFFLTPRELAAHHPEWHAALHGFFRQEPARTSGSPAL